MKTILFILLVLSSKTPDDISLYPQGFLSPSTNITDLGMKDEWDTHTQAGDAIYPVTDYYKAVLFFSQESLDTYLRSTKANGSILINVGQGTQGTVRQEKGAMGYLYATDEMGDWK